MRTGDFNPKDLVKYVNSNKVYRVVTKCCTLAGILRVKLQDLESNLVHWSYTPWQLVSAE